MMKVLGLVFLVACTSSRALPPETTPVTRQSLSPGVALSTFDSVWTVVQRTYVDTAFVATRWNAVRDSLRPRAMTVSTREGLSSLLAATLAEIPDSHFYIIPAAVATDVAPENESAASGEGTTGVSVRIAGDQALVWRVEPGSPGALAGIVPGQIVEQVRDRVVRTSLNRLNSLPEKLKQRALADLNYKLNGALSPDVGDTVRIRLIRAGEKSPIELALVGVPVGGTISKFGNLPPIAGVVRSSRLPVSSATAAPKSACVGVIAFNIWLPVLAPELERAVKSVADCAGIVLDVRGNPGGVGAMVMGFGGYFVESPVSLGTMRMRQLSLNFAINPRRIQVANISPGPFRGPVAILVDAMTASTSEIFATGMQRIGRARVFGQRSAGAALPALMQALPSGDVFVHAVADFTDPAGHRIEGSGVIPDELVPLTQSDLAHNIDAPLDVAVRWITSTAAKGTAGAH